MPVRRRKGEPEGNEGESPKGVKDADRGTARETGNTDREEGYNMDRKLRIVLTHEEAQRIADQLFPWL